MLVVGMVAAVGITAAAPASAATTESFALSSASLAGQSTVGWQVGLGNPPATPTTLTDPITLNGQIDPTSGDISAATLSIPSWGETQQGENVTFAFGEVNPGSATGTYDASTGSVTLNDSLNLTFSIASLGATCVTAPINVALSGTYDSTSQDVTLATTSSFTIPQFPSCTGSLGSAVLAGINASPGGIAGSVGNSFSIALNGEFAAGLPTTTALTTSLPSPQLAGTSVTLSAAVTDPSGAGTPTGTVTFSDNGANIGSGTLSSGSATLTTTTLPAGANQQLLATYSGDTTYGGSASSAVPYTVTPLPTVGANLPATMSVPSASVQPTVAAVSPNAGPPAGGTSVTITGTGFTPASTVDFGNTSAANVTVTNSTSITATSPAGTGTVDVTVGSPGGTSATSAADLFAYGAPTVTGVSPNGGPASSAFKNVTITGTHFVPGATVNFGSSAATAVTVTSPTSITVTAPTASAGTVDVTVTTSAGTSATSAADRYTFSDAVPAVSGLVTPAGPAAGGTSVVIDGFNLASATAVHFGSVAGTITANTATAVTATAPAGTSGTTVDVTVTTAGGTSGTWRYDQFTFGPPTVTAVSPAGGPAAGGTTVSITGTGFAASGVAAADGATVKFGTVAGTKVTVNSLTSITVTAPAGAGIVDVTVTTKFGGTSATSPADQFTYGPTVSGISPLSGPTTGGTLVAITGTGLTGATAVNFGAKPATGVTVVSPTSITAISPTGTAGTADVTVTTPSGTSVTSAADQFFYGPPTVTLVSPNAGPTTGGTSVTIAGTGFTAASAVKFGTTAATSFTVISPTQITAVSPTGASGLTHIVVTTNGGSSSATAAASGFTYNTAPSVASLTPNTGSPSGGTGVTITGANFTAASGVYFGTTAATGVTVVSPTTITATSPPGSGAVDVTVSSASGTSATGAGDVFAYGAPTVTAVTPNAGPTSGGSSVIVTGTGFVTGTTVSFGTTSSTSVTVTSPTSITAVSPAGNAGPVAVTATTAGGTSATSPSDLFTYSAGGAPGQASFTVTNPSTGQAWNNLYVKVVLNGITSQPASNVTLSYQDSSGGWCPLTPTGTTTTFTYEFSGVGSTCGSAPGSFSLAPNASLTVPLQLSYGSATYLGVQTVTATLFSGTCSSATSCTQSGALNGSVVGSGTVQLVPPGLVSSTVTDNNTTRPAITTVRQGFLVSVRSKVAATVAATGTPMPTGTVQYLVDGTPAAVVTSGGTPVSTPVPLSAGTTTLAYYDTAGLSPGTHTLVSEYLGDGVFGPSSLAETFTVLAPPTGTLFTCQDSYLAGGNYFVLGYVTATSTFPSPTPSGTNVLVNDGSVTLDVDPVMFANSSSIGALLSIPQTFAISPGDSTVSASGTSSASGSDDVLTWSGMSVSVPVIGDPGSTVSIGVDSFGSSGVTQSLTCTPVSQPAPMGTVTVAGTALTTSPSGSAARGTPVTLTAAVAPAPTTNPGTVEFYDGTTVLGSSPVSTTTGTATFTTNSLSSGDHTLTAQWSGTLSIPANTSDPVDFAVGTAPTITTQPTDQSVAPNKTATFTASADGDPTPSVQWQVSTDGGATFSDIPGATDMSYTTPATMLIDNGNQYQAVFNNGVGGNVVTSSATLTVGFSPATTGYRLATSNGGVLAFGTDTNYGSVTGPLNAPIVGMASTPDGGGYWLVAADGGIFTFGDAGFYGSQGGKPLNAPIVGMASTPDGGGYWLVAADGGIFTFGDAGFYGSQGGKPLNAPIVGMDGTPDGQGYWLVASDGGIFTFGDATFSGSEGGSPLNAPITGMAATPDGGGYWLVAADGGIFTFGDATFNGSAAGQSSAPVVGMVPTPDGGGYWIGAQDGGVCTFGNAPFDGSGVGMANAPVVAITQ